MEYISSLSRRLLLPFRGSPAYILYLHTIATEKGQGNRLSLLHCTASAGTVKDDHTSREKLMGEHFLHSLALPRPLPRSFPPLPSSPLGIAAVEAMKCQRRASTQRINDRRVGKSQINLRTASTCLDCDRPNDPQYGCQMNDVVIFSRH